MTKIRLYKMTHATGFAPNHKGDVLTLATCKSYIRKVAKVGDYIAGLTSSNKEGGNTTVGNEKLIYLMKVNEIITFKEYWKKYPGKRGPYGLGDNIYEYDITERKNYRQHDNGNHFEKDKDSDLISENVLISKEYKYFGRTNPLDISSFKPYLNIPKYCAPYGFISENEKVDEFIKYVMAQNAVSDIEYFLNKKSDSSSKCGTKNNK